MRVNFKTASTIYDFITSVKYERDSDFTELRDQLLKHAAEYARLRVDWQLQSHAERIKMDARRTAAHNVFINSCNILSRYMGNNDMDGSWREDLTENRKTIGDSACICTYY